VTALAALAQVTTHTGLIATASTTYTEPFTRLSRKGTFARLRVPFSADH
jgi:alkanesulfonate monooxygenase SsuD/methylene tetrahydromethanopterin reductase-like flavin-dependent oxidoreductase (luciferase family)